MVPEVKVAANLAVHIQQAQMVAQTQVMAAVAGRVQERLQEKMVEVELLLFAMQAAQLKLQGAQSHPTHRAQPHIKCTHLHPEERLLLFRLSQHTHQQPHKTAV